MTLVVWALATVAFWVWTSEVSLAGSALALGFSVGSMLLVGMYSKVPCWCR